MGGLEPPRGYPHYHLKVARIPIPPHSQTEESLWKEHYLSVLGLSHQAQKLLLKERGKENGRKKDIG